MGENLQNLLERALQQDQAGKLDEAETLYRQILAAQPNHPDALHLLGLLTRQRGNLNEAIHLVRQATIVNPIFVWFRKNLGSLLAETGDWSAALSEYEQALRLDSSIADLHADYARAL